MSPNNPIKERESKWDWRDKKREGGRDGRRGRERGREGAEWRVGRTFVLYWLT